MENSVKAADQRIAEISAELGTQRLIQKHCDSYRLCRKVIEDCKSAKNPKAYRTKHQTEYQLHDSLKKGLQDLGVTKIPSSKKGSIPKNTDCKISVLLSSFTYIS